MLLRFVLTRAGSALFLAFGIVAVSFVLIALLPGDAATSRLSERAAADPELVASMRRRYGLDQPLFVQFFIYLGNLLRGDLGTSVRTQNSVVSDLAQFAPASAELALVATAVAVVVGIGFGIVSALRANSFLDQALRVVSLGGLSLPIFWLALIALFLFSIILGIVPSSGRLGPGENPPAHITGMYTVDSFLTGDWALFATSLSHLILPALVLSAPMVGLLLRFTRSSVLEVLNNEYVRAAEAKGLPARTVVLRHVLRAALVPVITVLGTAFASLLAGTVLVEQIFGWPGIGAYAFRSASSLDMPAIVGVTLFIAIVYVGVNLLVDILYGLIDPRIRRA